MRATINRKQLLSGRSSSDFERAWGKMCSIFCCREKSFANMSQVSLDSPTNLYNMANLFHRS